MTSPTNTWSTDKPYNLRQTLERKNSVDSGKLKSPLAAGAIIKPVKITPGSETRATSASPVGNIKTTTATETKKTNDKKAKELELDKPNSATTTGTVGKEIKIPDCKVLLKDTTRDESQTRRIPESTDRRVVITDPTVAETGETQHTSRDLTGATKVETKHTKEVKDKDDEEEGEADQEKAKDKKQEDLEVQIEDKEDETDEENEEEEEDEETQTQNFDKLFDGPTALKDGQPLLTLPIYRAISTQEKELFGKTCRADAPKPSVVKERITTNCTEIVKEKRKGTSTRQKKKKKTWETGASYHKFSLELKTQSTGGKLSNCG